MCQGPERLPPSRCASALALSLGIAGRHWGAGSDAPPARGAGSLVGASFRPGPSSASPPTANYTPSPPPLSGHAVWVALTQSFVLQGCTYDPSRASQGHEAQFQNFR